MKHMALIITIVLMSFGNGTSQINYFEETHLNRPDNSLKVFNFEELQSYLSTKDAKKTYVINFWATWCAPCVKELPYFEQLNAKYSNHNVEVILVSLDFPKQIETKLKPFLKKNALKSEVVVLDDVDSNTWIPKVNKNWSGAIPATLIYNKDKKAFYERSFNYQELETEVKQFIK
ncbi:redoxin domain-containing protein [uncultured Psychroserpens sp.]|uniref:redoxin domain-containing protein n=1 Tax=uncultured Psychroserpens sp. TaxID=255436 RepID=UPI002613C624|nr:redoxin domain-containing protein [uncultured Psychroserpens sp.]